MDNQILPKPLVWILGIILIVVLALVAVDKGYAIADKQKKSGTPANTISVSADGKVKATPDLATVTIGVMTQGKDAADVQSKNNEKINKIIDFVKNQGVSKEDITTSQFYAYPQQDWKNGTATIVGYQSNQTITVKVHGINNSQTKLESVISGAVDNGANEIQGVTFGFDDPDNFRQEARKQAIAKAKTKAEELAKEAGLTLGRVVSVQESGSYTPPMPYAADAYGRGGAMAQEKSVAPNIEPGSQDITQTMTVIYELK